MDKVQQNLQDAKKHVQEGDFQAVEQDLTEAKDNLVDALAKDLRICTKCGCDTAGHGYSVTWVNGVEDLSTLLCHDCEEARRLEAYKKDRVITTRLMMDATSYSMRDEIDTYARKYREEIPELEEVLQAMAHLKLLVKLFDRDVWKPRGEEDGLARIVRSSSYHGLSGKLKVNRGFDKFLAGAWAGRALITIQSPKGSMITLITAEDYKPEEYDFDIGSPFKMGIQGIHATAEVAEMLLTNAMEAWVKGEVTMEEDPEVGLG